MTICNGCNSPIEPLAQIRTYHTQCDPRGKVDHLTRIVTAADALHDELLKQIDALMGADADTEEAEKLDRLAHIVEAYEEYRWPITRAFIDVLKKGEGKP